MASKTHRYLMYNCKVFIFLHKVLALVSTGSEDENTTFSSWALGLGQQTNFVSVWLSVFCARKFKSFCGLHFTLQSSTNFTKQTLKSWPAAGRLFESKQNTVTIQQNTSVYFIDNPLHRKYVTDKDVKLSTSWLIKRENCLFLQLDTASLRNRTGLDTFLCTCPNWGPTLFVFNTVLFVAENKQH